MNKSRLVYTCNYIGHENEPINAYCINMHCNDNPQCCIECLLNKHQDHREDCKSMNKLSQITQEAILFLEEWNLQNERAFQTVQKAYSEIQKKLYSKKMKMTELQKNLEKPLFLISNKDMMRLWKWNLQLQNMPHPAKVYFIIALDEMEKQKNTIDSFGNQLQDQEEQKLKLIELLEDEEQIIKTIMEQGLQQNILRIIF